MKDMKKDEMPKEEGAPAAPAPPAASAMPDKSMPMK